MIFFFASAGASAAYLTASEVFPMETRALCIAFFYAIGTAAGGITGPLLFGKLIDNASASKDITGIAVGYFIGAALMIAGGIVEAFLGQGRGPVAGEHRPAADRRGRRHGPRPRRPHRRARDRLRRVRDGPSRRAVRRQAARPGRSRPGRAASWRRAVDARVSRR